MDRFFTDLVDAENNSVMIENKEDIKHITKVLRYSEGDKLEVCDGNDNEYIVEITEMDKSMVKASIIEKVDIKRESSVRIKIYQGIPKGQKFDLIIQKLTEVGVAEMIPVDTKRVVSKFDAKKEAKKMERWERIIYEASKQSKRGRIPVLREPLSFKKAVEDCKDNTVNFVFYENERNKSIRNIIRENKDIESIGIFIGPEGGFESDEIDELTSAGVNCVTLGNRILRTETASIVGASIVLYELGELGGVE